AAELEARSALAAKKPDQPEMDSDFLLLIATIAGQRQDDDLAIVCYEQALKNNRQNELRFREDELGADAMAQLAFRRARSAQKRGDTKAADAQIRELLDLSPANTDVAIEMVNWLKQTSRADEAKKLFGKLYDDAK